MISAAVSRRIFEAAMTVLADEPNADSLEMIGGAWDSRGCNTGMMCSLCLAIMKREG